ncbi:uncharacterized protein LOC101859266 [Aplysia californica]|uniref:Uncharacterized protein LOC101859266 n=1 Tax=Aplysia californica TaxID=6500 RepID=A0ABM1W080_APLCA|nr:uncharacterized protein LOC101859266 [Aplysia californica]XP_035828073.1 uncharacterized protein LOC101859266 [Aplysia californica]
MTKQSMKVRETSLHLMMIMLAAFPGLCWGNQMDPHVYPDQGPFFEGWYMRIIDAGNERSFGWLFGRVLPTKSASSVPCEDESLKLLFTSERCKEVRDNVKNNFMNGSLPLVYSSLLINSGPKSKLQAVTGFFEPEDYVITKKGKPVEENPDDATPPSFEAKIGDNVTFVVKPSGTTFSLTVGNIVLRGSTSSPVPWGPNGEGPEGWLEYLPLPIHWFVYSLRSNVVHYEYINKLTGQTLSGPDHNGVPVVAHMEKDWGKSFPKAWIWSEGVDPWTNVSFAISSGIVTELGVDLKAQLSGYRNPNKGIHCSFSPANSVHHLTSDGCSNTATLVSESLECKVIYQLSAPLGSFSDCLFTPQYKGFRPGCLESYRAVANITVYQRHFVEMELTDHQVVKLAALEFGEEYMCHGKCPPKSEL